MIQFLRRKNWKLHQCDRKKSPVAQGAAPIRFYNCKFINFENVCPKAYKLIDRHVNSKNAWRCDPKHSR